MASILTFDELNRLEGKSISHEDYFSAIPGLSKTQVRKRIKLAKDIDENVKKVFDLIPFLLFHNKIDWNELETQIEDLMFLAVSGSLAEGEMSEEIMMHLRIMAMEIIDVTQRNFQIVGPEPGDVAASVLAATTDRKDAEFKGGYYVSGRRATIIGQNTSNQVFNHVDNRNAVKNGYTRKQWISMRDAFVRPTHHIADSQTRKIDEPFIVGNSLLMYPTDWSLGASPEEIINCRCGIIYMM